MDDNSRLIQHLFSSFQKRSLNQFAVTELIISLLLWRYISEKKDASPVINIPDNCRFFSKKDSPAFTIYINETLIKLEELNSAVLKNLLILHKPVLFSVGDDLLLDACTQIELFPLREPSFINALFNVIESQHAASNIDTPLNFTPKEVAQLLARCFTKSKKNSSLYDPFCRTGDLLYEASKADLNITSVSGNVPDHFSWKLAKAKALLLNFHQPSFLHQSIYENSKMVRFDYIITNPPFGEKPHKQIKNESDGWTKLYGGIKSELDYLCYALDHLSLNGQMAIIVPDTLLSSDKTLELRKQLIEENYLEAVLSLPQNIFHRTRATTAILLLNKTRKKQPVLFIDASQKGNKKRERYTLSEDNIQNIITNINSFRSGKLLADSNCIEITRHQLQDKLFDFRFEVYQEDTKRVFIASASSDKIWEEILSLQKDVENNMAKIIQLQNDSR